MIPYSANDTTYAFLGPLPDPNIDSKELSEFFHGSDQTLPKIFTKGPYQMSFMNQRPFRSVPSESQITTYLKWLKKIEARKSPHWKILGIFNLIQLSKTGLKYDPILLLSALDFWEGLTDTLQLKLAC